MARRLLCELRPPAAARRTMLGQILDDKYAIVRLIGEGGMGAVYEAQHVGTGRRVALKVLLGGAAAKNDSDLVARFQREARAAGAIDTQHIVQVLDTGTERGSGVPYLVLELLSGGDVGALLARLGPLPPNLALRIVAQACLGLQKAHEANVVHRDIKPANLFLARREGGELIVKILDFGIAKMRVDHGLDSQGHALTRTGSMLGSPAYMSPEQAKGLKSIDHRTDVWSLGAVLYEALCGTTPHHEIETLGQLIIAICAAPPRPVQERAPWIGREIAAVVDRALRLDPAERFASAAAMLDAIRPLLTDGASLREDMLVPLPPEQRALASQRSPSPAEVGATAALTVRTGPLSAVISQSHPSVSVARSGRAARAAAVVAIVAAGALAAGLVVKGRYDALRHATGSGWASAEPAPAPPAVSSTEAATAAPPPAAVAIEPRSVRLGVPAQASVQVDGVAARVEGGSVEIAGALGSVHTVRVVVGARETSSEVVIAEGGPVPSRIELAAGAPVAAHPARPSPVPVATATPTPATPATSRPSVAPIDTSFH